MTSDYRPRPVSEVEAQRRMRLHLRLLLASFSALVLVTAVTALVQA